MRRGVVLEASSASPNRQAIPSEKENFPFGVASPFGTYEGTYSRLRRLQLVPLGKLLVATEALRDFTSRRAEWER
jgi:hypothetical protein